MNKCFYNQIGWDGCTVPADILPAGIDLQFLADISKTTGKKLFEKSINLIFEQVSNDILLHSGAELKIERFAYPKSCENCTVESNGGNLGYKTYKIIVAESLVIDSPENRNVEVTISGITKDGEDYNEVVTVRTNIPYPINKKFKSIDISYSESITVYSENCIPCACMCSCADDRNGIYLKGYVQCDLEEIICQNFSKELFRLKLGIHLMMLAINSTRKNLTAESKDQHAWMKQEYEKKYNTDLIVWVIKFKNSLDFDCFYCDGIKYVQG